MRLLFIVAVAVAFTASCQRSENRKLARKVGLTDLIGTWVLTPEGVEGLRFAGHRKHLMVSDHQIELRSGGRCRYHSFRDVTELSGDDEGYVWSDCGWDLQDQEQQTVQLRLDVDRSTVVFRIAEERGQLLLWQHAADPDAWKYFEFAKDRPPGASTP